MKTGRRPALSLGSERGLDRLALAVGLGEPAGSVHRVLPLGGDGRVDARVREEAEQC